MVELGSAISIIFLSLLASEFFTLWRKFRMHKEAKRLADIGWLPTGSEIRHGMVLSPTNKNEVVGVSMKTSAWFNRLY